MRRSNTHIVMGLGFVGAAVLVAGSIYIGLEAGAAVERSPTLINEFVAAPENTATLENELAQLVTDDSQTTTQPLSESQHSVVPLRKRMVDYYYSEVVNAEDRCEGTRWSFEPDGTFELVGKHRNEIIRSQWNLTGNHLSLTNGETINTDDQSSSPLEDSATEIRWSNGALLFGTIKVYPCNI